MAVSPVTPVPSHRGKKVVKKALLFLVVIALGLTALAYLTTHRNGGAKDDEYKTAHVKYDDIRDVISSMASIRPLDGIPVQSMIAGQVVELNAKFNDIVEEGQTLLKLDPTDAQNKVARAKAARASARAAVGLANAQLEAAERGQKAVKAVRDKVHANEKNYGELDRLKADAELEKADGLVIQARAAIPAAEAKVQEAEAAVKEAELGLQYTTITVPRFQIDEVNPQPKRKYIVLDRKVERAQNIDAKQVLFTLIADLEHMQAHAFIPESRIDRVAKGQQ